MSATNDTVHDRIERARADLSPPQVAAGVAIAAALGFALMFLQDPLAHEALHNFRHAAGITCH
ncbi:CbtB domain-containing protein [Halegenticoccus soli]|uniref:CbtB domain-containing protein n=1 Tax=Halegenticoccus soli TaxID=1985678 RepID=UPI000C6E739C|nr:CbtB domain-containing protein [Halegenticoccus soli]